MGLSNRPAQPFVTRIFHTPTIASSAMALLILETPRSRSGNTMGTSAMRAPA